MGTMVVSTFFVNTAHLSRSKTNLCDDLLHIVDELNLALEQLKLPPIVHCVYNPTIYARTTFEMYVRKYCNTVKPILYFGMNPGPWGMSQTGVRLFVLVLCFYQSLHIPFSFIHDLHA